MKYYAILMLAGIVWIAGCTQTPSATTNIPTVNTSTPTTTTVTPDPVIDTTDVGDTTSVTTPSTDTDSGTTTPTPTLEDVDAVTYTGTRLAGTTAPYLEFNQADYDTALAADKIIVLDFYANWCPICRAEEPALFEGFNSLTSDHDRVVGFRVNYNDDDTDEAEEVLADQFDITYQHTKVILKNGEPILTTQSTWTAEQLRAEVEAAI